MKYDSVFVGINETKLSHPTFYPNPSTTFLTVNFINISNKINSIVITDIKGIKIFEAQISAQEATINVANYPVGIYIVRLKSDTFDYISKFCKN